MALQSERLEATGEPITRPARPTCPPHQNLRMKRLLLAVAEQLTTTLTRRPVEGHFLIFYPTLDMPDLESGQFRQSEWAHLEASQPGPGMGRPAPVSMTRSECRYQRATAAI